MHEDVPEESILIRGAYFSNAEASVPKENRLIDFFILDPNFQVVYSRRSKEEGIFRLDTKLKGQYTFVFSNMKDRINAKSVTLAIHPGYDTDAKEREEMLAQEAENRAIIQQAGISEQEI